MYYFIYDFEKCSILLCPSTPIITSYHPVDNKVWAYKSYIRNHIVLISTKIESERMERKAYDDLSQLKNK